MARQNSLSKAYFLFLIIFLIGTFFRFYNIDGKIFWIDETYTSLRISGYTGVEVVRELSSKGIVNSSELERFQYPNEERNLGETLLSLAQEDVHPPIYFTLVKFWTQIWGNSISSIRGFSAVCSVFSILLIYQLGWELFQSRLTAIVSSIIVSLSPFHLLFSQEARMYSLLIVAILLSSILILRALRHQNQRSFLLYSLSLSFGLLTHYFFIFIVASQGLYVLILDKFKLTRRVSLYLLSLMSGLSICLPWLYYVKTNSIRLSDATSEKDTARSILGSLAVQAGHLRNVFIDLNPGSIESPIPNIPFYGFASILVVCLLILYSFYCLITNTPQRVWIFIVLMACSTTVPVMFTDILFGQDKLTIFRYYLPFYLAVQLSVSFLISYWMSAKNITKQNLSKCLFGVVTFASVSSCIVISQSGTWWIKTNYPPVAKVAESVNFLERPLVIGYSSSSINNAHKDIQNVLMLGHKLKAETKFLLLSDDSEPKINQAYDFSDVIVYKVPKQNSIRDTCTFVEQYSEDIMRFNHCR